MARKLIPTSQLHTKGIRYSRPHRYRKIKEGTFPQPIKGCGREDAFDEAELDAYVEAMAAQRPIRFAPASPGK